jgi:hypothetical protein
MFKNISPDLTIEILKPYGMIFDTVVEIYFYLNDYGHSVSGPDGV